MNTIHVGELINLEELIDDERCVIGHEFLACEVHLPGPMLCSGGTTWHEGAVTIDGCTFIDCTIRPVVLMPQMLIGGAGHSECCPLFGLMTTIKGCFIDTNRLVLGCATYGDYN